MKSSYELIAICICIIEYIVDKQLNFHFMMLEHKTLNKTKNNHLLLPIVHVITSSVFIGVFISNKMRFSTKVFLFFFLLNILFVVCQFKSILWNSPISFFAFAKFLFVIFVHHCTFHWQKCTFEMLSKGFCNICIFYENHCEVFLQHHWGILLDLFCLVEKLIQYCCFSQFPVH